MSRASGRHIELSRLSPGDLVREAVAGAFQRRGRSLLTVVGTAFGVGAFVAVLGLTATAGSQISQRFTVLAATEVTVEQVRPEGAAYHDLAFPPEADHLVRALPGVREAGVLWTVGAHRSVTSFPPSTLIAGVGSGDSVPVMAVSAGALRATRPQLSHGVIYNEFHDSRAELVAVLGAAAASRLGIARLDAQPAIFVDGTPLTVIGVIDDVQRRTDVLFAVLVPRRTVEALWGAPTGGDDPARMLVDTDLGAAQVVGRQAALALRPDAPELFRVYTPPDPRSLREGVGSDLDALFLVLAAICLVVAGVGIANTTLVAVLERVPEIGLRRALGARPRHIAGQFIAESSALGTLGGLAGMSGGVLTVLATASLRRWTPVIEPWTILTAPLLGFTIGLLAGLYPAVRAALIEPTDALRR